MNETSPRPSLRQRSWNEPRLFFLWLTLLSLAGFALALVISHVPWWPSHPSLVLQNIGTFLMLILALTLLLGAIGFILSLIPPVRHWLERVLRRRFFALACVLTLIALVVVEEDWRGRRAWNAYKAECEAKGENFNWQSVIPAAVPDDQNFAMSPVWIAATKQSFNNEDRPREWYGDKINDPAVIRLEPLMPAGINHSNTMEVARMGDWSRNRLTDLKLWQDYYRQPEKKMAVADFPVSVQPQAPAEDVLLALSKYDPLIEQLREDAKRPESRFPINYQSEPVLFPHLASIKRMNQVLELRAVAELQAGRSDAALADDQLLFRLADALHTEPFLISHLVRMALFQTALQPLWEGLARHQWSDAQLVEMDNVLRSLDLLADYKYALRGESAFAIGTLDESRRSGVWLLWSDSSPMSSLFIPNAFFYQNELSEARMFQQWLVPLVNLETHTVSPKFVNKTISTSERELGRPLLYYRIFARLTFPAYPNSVKRFAQTQESLDLARVAIALERYRLAHGQYPETLDVLAPVFLDKLPHDIIGSQPLHYRRTENGKFVLYSVGWNDKDDGGVVKFTQATAPGLGLEKGDWVWQYPD